MRTDVVIVGAGLSGLTCARLLTQQGVAVQVLEASDGVGGRVRTDEHEGFLLDRGFQVLLTAYPETRLALDYAALRPRAYKPGALVRWRGALHVVADPFRDPLHALQTALSPIGTLRDKLLVARLRHDVTYRPVAELWRRPEETILAFLRSFGFSPALVDRFFRPFFGGILLDRELQASSRLFTFLFRMFATGDTVLPEGGMGSIPAQLAHDLPTGTVRLRTRVVHVGDGVVTLSSGETVLAKAVVIATDGPSAAQLGALVKAPPERSVSCMYFAAPQPPVDGPWLVLDGEGQGPVNNLSCPSVVAPRYAPPGQTLVSASILGVPRMSDQALEQAVRQEFRGWFGTAVDAWRYLRTYRIPHAQPAQVPPGRELLAPRVSNGLYLCGDYRATPSIQGAMRAGRQAAEAVWNDFAR